MRIRLRTAAALLLFAGAAPPVVAAPAALHGVAVDARLSDAPVALEASSPLPIAVYLSADDLRAPSPQLERHIAAYAARRSPLVIALGPLPAADADVDAWRQNLQAVVQQGRGRVAGYEVGNWDTATPPDVDGYAYLLKLAAVTIRAADENALVVQGSGPGLSIDWQGQLYTAGIAPYEDAIALDARAATSPAFQSSVDALLALVAREDPTTQLVLRGVALPAAPAAASAMLLQVEMRWLARAVGLVTYSGAKPSIAAAMTSAGRVGDLLAGDLVPLDEQAAGLRIVQSGADVTSRITHRLLFSPSTSGTWLVYDGRAASDSQTTLEVTVSNPGTPTIRDAVTGASRPAAPAPGAASGGALRLLLTGAGHPLVVDFSVGADSGFSTVADVTRETLPRVEEIISRYQQAQTVQDGLLRNYIAHVRMEQHFRPSAADAAYNVITENRLFSDRSGVEWEELSFELNGAKWTSNRPAFPLVQPEKVLSLPLDLRLDQDYRYKLEGVDTVGGREAFVVRFDPVPSSRALYRGTVWIDRRTFVRLQVHAVETRLSGPVVSNDETQTFASAGDVDGRPIWLLANLNSQQVFLIAGRSVLVERSVRLSGIELNAAQFDGSRAEARASNRVMYRDTDAGVRYFVKKGEAREVSNQLTTSARALALGTDIDPSFDTPLPIGGLDILDFNFLKRDMQLALLFGGVIAAGNIQHANLWGGKFDASLDFFGFALKSNDDLFDANGKRAGERVDHIPASTGLNVGYQIDPFNKISGHYVFKYDAYFRDATTASTFLVPGSTATTGEGLSYEYRRRGYSLVGNATAFQRLSWQAWGAPGSADFRTSDRTYVQYDAGLSKDFVFNTFHTIHLNGTYFGGSRLDRFSAYQFGIFDATRMHGVPTAVRFGDLAMLRGSYSFNLFDQYRFDLFLDYAKGRDPLGDNIWRNVTGTGVRLNLRAPRSTVLQVDAGRSFLPSIYQGAGSFVLQILLLKPL